MRSLIFSVVLVAGAGVSGCGANNLDQGSGTSGLFPLFKKEKNERTERPDSLSRPGLPVDLQEVMFRWNEVASGRTVTAHGIEFDFLWIEQDRFPHPTFKGGARESYEVFAEIFIDFFEGGENLQYVRTNKLQYVDIISGSNASLVTSLYKLGEDLSNNEMVTEGSRQKIFEIWIKLPENKTMTEVR